MSASPRNLPHPGIIGVHAGEDVKIPSGSVKKVAHTLVVGPAKDTLTRPVGDWDDFLEY